MTTNERFESTLAAWLTSASPATPPPGLIDNVLGATGRTKPLSIWRAMLDVPVVRAPAAVLVGSPALRLARVLAPLVLVLALAALAAVVGASLLQDRPTEAPRVQMIVYVDSIPVGSFGNEQDAIITKLLSWSQTEPRVAYEGSGYEIVHPLISPDGTRVAFTEREGGLGGCDLLKILHLGDGTVTPVRKLPRNYASFVWSPSGDRLAYVGPCGESATENANRVFVFDVAGSTSRQLPEPPDSAPGPGPDWRGVAVEGWSPDGSALLVSQEQQCEPNCGHESLLRVDAVSGDVPSVVINDWLASPQAELGLFAASWSWDGSSILLNARAPSLEVVDPDGSSRRVVAEAEGFGAWSPGEDRIVYFEPASSSTSGNRVMVVNGDGSNPTAVALARGIDRYQDKVGWSSCGSTIWWTDGFGTWYIRLDGTEAVTKIAPAHSDLAWGLAAEGQKAE